MGAKKMQQALPRWALPALCGGILLLIICGWAIYAGGNQRKAAEATVRPDIFSDNATDQRH